MKRLLFALALFISLASLGQAPESFMYQAVARNNFGGLLANQNVTFQLSILEGSAGGSVVYQEVHPATTNAFGIVNLEVGTGLVGVGDFSSIDWGGNSYFLQTELDPNGGFVFELIGTTQLLSVPYALYAAAAGNVDDADADPSNEIQTLSIADNELTISDGNTITLPSGGGSEGNTLQGAYDQGGPGAGRVINADNGAIEVNSSSVNAIGLDATANGNGSVALAGEVTQAGNAFSAIQGITNSNSTLASAVVGNSDGAAWGVTGQVTQFATAQSGVYGSNFRTTGGHGVLGQGFNGVVGETDYRAGFGIYGYNYDNLGSTANLAIGTAGTGYYGVVGEDLYLGTVLGAYGVFANGDLGTSGFKLFQIDHPDDPENYYLRHFCLESNEVLNIYRGNVVLGENGEATVVLPEYFDDININFSYQLTPIGAPAQLYVKEKIVGNEFVIAGGEPGMEISWTVQAERNDPYAQAFPEKKTDILKKSERDRNRYLIPSLFGAENDQKIIQGPEKMKQQPTNLFKR